jgi:hypothetical protein
MNEKKRTKETEVEIMKRLKSGKPSPKFDEEDI